MSSSNQDADDKLKKPEEAASERYGAEDEAAAMLDKPKGNDTLTGLRRQAAESSQALELELVLDIPDRQALPRKAGLEKDSEGRIRAINYPDKSYREFDYQGKTPSQMRTYSCDGKLRDTVDLKSKPSLQYDLKPDGTLEAKQYKVTTFQGDAIYDRQGKELGKHITEFRELKIVNSLHADGSVSTRKEYPGGGSRELRSKDGKAFEYTYTAPGGQKEVWNRDLDTANWYRSTDTAKTRAWSGSVEMQSDGRMLEKETNGRITEISSEGKRDVAPEMNVWKKDLFALADRNLAGDEPRKQFKENIEKIEKRVKAGEISEAEAGALFKDLFRLGNIDSRKGLSKDQMLVLMQQVAHQAANPDKIDQGPYNNCNMSSPELRIFSKEPATAAKLIADCAITGKYTDSKGQEVDISESLQPADNIHSKLPPGENERSHASQIFHLVAINLELQSLLPGQNIKYVQKPATTGDNGARIVDYNQNPPAEVYSFAAGKPVHKSTPVMDPSGNQLVDENLQGKMTRPMDTIGLTIQNSCNVLEKITGKKEVGATIGHFSQVGFAANWILDYVNLSPHKQKDARIPYFKNEAELETLLGNLKREGRMPVVLEVNSGSGFLRKQVEEAAGKTMGGEGGLFGGGHVLCIRDFDPVSKKVHLDNTWGSSRDRLGAKAASLTDVVEISKADPKLLEAATKYNSDLQKAYKSWCHENGKTPGKDFPSPEAGKAYLQKWKARVEEERRRAELEPTFYVPF